MSNNTKPSKGNSSEVILSQDEMAKMSAYASATRDEHKPETDNNQSSAQQSSSNKRNRRKPTLQKTESKLAKVRRQYDALKQQVKDARENTPTIAVRSDSIDLVYTGKVAGKTTNRFVPIVKNDQVELLKPLLTPIVSILNAAIRQKQLEESPWEIRTGNSQKLAKSTDNSTIFQATALTRGQVAYEQLFANKEFLQKLKELADVCETIYANGTQPAAVKTISRLPRKGNSKNPEFRVNPELASEFQQYIAELDSIASQAEGDEDTDEVE